MLKYRVRNSQITVAMIIILLCVASLVGVTFALFTNGEDGKIGVNVTSGKVKIDIVDPENESLSLRGGTLSFGGETIVLEPGAVFHTKPFKIKNIGDVPVNYFIYVEKVAYDDEKYLEALEFYVVEYSKLENTELREVMDDPALKDTNSFEGTLAPGEIGESYCLVIKMKENAGVEVMNKTLAGVGITVFGVQGNVDASDALESSTESTTNGAETESATNGTETESAIGTDDITATESTEKESASETESANDTAAESTTEQVPQ